MWLLVDGSWYNLWMRTIQIHLRLPITLSAFQHSLHALIQRNVPHEDLLYTPGCTWLHVRKAPETDKKFQKQHRFNFRDIVHEVPPNLQTPCTEKNLTEKRKIN